MDSSLATNKRLVLFGDFRSYWINAAGGPLLRRADELRLLTNQTVFVAFRRSDANLVNAPCDLEARNPTRYPQAPRVRSLTPFRLRA